MRAVTNALVRPDPMILGLRDESRASSPGARRFHRSAAFTGRRHAGGHGPAPARPPGRRGRRRARGPSRGNSSTAPTAARWCTATDVWDATPLALDLARETPAPRGARTELASRARLVASRARARRGARRLEEARRPAQPRTRRGRGRHRARARRGRSASSAFPCSSRASSCRPRPRCGAWPVSAPPGIVGPIRHEGARRVVDGRRRRTQSTRPHSSGRSAAGAGLLNVDGRWVRLDPTAARKALKELSATATTTPSWTRPACWPSRPRSAAERQPNRRRRTSTTTDPRPRGSASCSAGCPTRRSRRARCPPGFVATLRPYQRRGLGWLQFLAGSVSAAASPTTWGSARPPRPWPTWSSGPGPHLVVCPLSVVRNWQSEAARFTPEPAGAGPPRHRPASGRGARRRRRQPISWCRTYGLVARDVEALAAVPWSTVVLDEAQAIKNAHTKAATAVRRIPAAQKLALTGTPVENRLGELWAILDVVNPGLLGSEHQFRERWVDAHRARRRPRGRGPAAAPRPRRSCLRRTKADKSLVPDLPDKVEQVAWATLTKEQAMLYQAVVDELLKAAERSDGMQRRGLVLAALTRLKQICNHPAHALGDGSRLAGRSGQARPVRRTGRRSPRRRRTGAGVHPVPRDGRAAAAAPRRVALAARRRSSTAASPSHDATGWSSSSRRATAGRCCSSR